MDAAEFQPAFHRGNEQEKVLFPYCKYGTDTSDELADGCGGASYPIRTPHGTCHTINANNRFGKVVRVGSKYGLELAIDMQYYEKHLIRLKEEDTSYVKVGCQKMTHTIHG